MQPQPLEKFFWAKLIRFRKIWLDLGKILAKLEQNLGNEIRTKVIRYGHSRIGDRMFLRMQDFILPKSYHFCLNFASILPKFRLNFAPISPKSNQICLNLINFAQKDFARGCGCIPSSYDTGFGQI